MPYKWTPPPPASRTLEIPGNPKVYHPGDMVPISKEAALHLMRYGAHNFEGLDAPEADLPTPTEAQAKAEK